MDTTKRTELLSSIFTLFVKSKKLKKKHKNDTRERKQVSMKGFFTLCWQKQTIQGTEQRHRDPLLHDCVIKRNGKKRN